MKNIVWATSLVCFLLHNISAQQAPGDNFFNSSNVHTIKLTFNQPSFWDSLTTYKQQGDLSGTYYYMVAKVEIDGNVLDSIGVRLKGNSSYNSYPTNKKPFKLDFNEYKSGQKYDGVKKMNLNNSFKDPTMMREKLAYDFCRNVWINSPRCTYANLYINNENWGLYVAVEEIDATFLKNRFSNKDGNLFKGDPQGSLQFFGYLAASYYPKYELKNNETLNDWSDLINLIDKINNSGPTNYYNEMKNVLNMGSYIRNRAMNILFANLDSYDGSKHNYYLYHDTLGDRFEWLPWDVNEAFGNFNMGMTIPQLECLDIFYIPNPQTNSPLAKNTLDNAALKLEYTWHMNDFIQYYFSENYLFPTIDSLYNKIKSYVYADTKKMYTNQHFEDNINQNISVGGGPGGGNIAGLKSFITNRRNCVNTQLMQLGYPNVSVTEIIADNTLKIYPNPANALLTIESENSSIENIEITDCIGKVVFCFPFNDIQPYTHTVDIQTLRNGLYFVKTTSNGKINTSKLIKF
ncbi:MAG: T9SS type A sorting domain-containing protein [Bacteroidetes bacterium]|nr:T9SS C-terminal target domain-containing protein [Bacteroidota bacterium]MBV6461780.1 hypothetical protein [Flavobacteriales bacterium]WKZ75895.1 MAG: CotH kinase family protein [Vicingaceae bacterium]MCL4816727.1 CotH kinase family protein [Flavobacteriales bacterium]NOG95571.1 T9SS type A sorting domain-containing protein [Bacteroidota bacterium]